MIHATINAICQIFTADWLNPQDHNDEWQYKTGIQNHLHQFTFAAVFQWIPMHSSHAQTRKCENGTQNTTWYSYTKLHNDFWCWTTENQPNGTINTRFAYEFVILAQCKLTYDDETPRSSRYTEALSLKLLYACSSPTSNVFSSTMRIIIATNKYTKPVTIQVERSPIDSSLLKYCTVSEINNLLKNKCQVN